MKLCLSLALGAFLLIIGALAQPSSIHHRYHDEYDCRYMISSMYRNSSSAFLGDLDQLEPQILSCFNNVSEIPDFLQLLRRRRVLDEDYHHSDESVLAERDVCIPQLQSVALDLPVAKNIHYFPTSVRLERCGGSCYGSFLTCRPTELESITLTVLKVVTWNYNSTSDDVDYEEDTRESRSIDYDYMSNRSYPRGLVRCRENGNVEEHWNCPKDRATLHKVHEVRHRGCTCACKVMKKDCNPIIHKYPKGKCACVCKNKDEKRKCEEWNSTKYWDNDTCACYFLKNQDFSSGGSSSPSYHRYKVVSVRPKSPNEAELVRAVIGKMSLDQWTDPVKWRENISVMVSPQQTFFFLEYLHRWNISFNIMMDDVQAVIDQQYMQQPHQGNRNYPFLNNSMMDMHHDYMMDMHHDYMMDRYPYPYDEIDRYHVAIDHHRYHELHEIYDIVRDIASKYWRIVSVYAAGATYEGRDILVVKVSSGGDPMKPVIWIDCGIHAREWIAPATCLWILDHLTSRYGIDIEVTQILERYDFHIMPCVNPDGYSYTWASKNNRLWVKNRVPVGSVFVCNGVNLNRNFDANFSGPGTSDNPCSDLYHGQSAFSEKESLAVRDSITALVGRVTMYVSLHSFSQLWLTPYSFTTVQPSNYEDQLRVAHVGVEAIMAANGTKFDYGNSAEIRSEFSRSQAPLSLTIHFHNDTIKAYTSTVIIARP